MRPYRIFFFIACCMLCLGALCVTLPHQVVVGTRTLRSPSLADVFDIKQQEAELAEKEENTILELPEFPELEETASETNNDSVEEAATTPAQQTQRITPPVVQVDTTDDSRRYLATFYAALQHADNRQIRVLHYGDSQIEEDRMTAQIRHKLQDRFGGAGVGLMPLVQTIRSLSVDQKVYMNDHLVTAQQGPKRYMVYGLRSMQRTDGKYGPMGQMAVMADSLVKGSEKIKTVCTPIDGRARYTRWRVLADKSIEYMHNGDTLYLYGKGNVYGLSQESSTGIIVDNIAMRGCLGLVFTRMDAEQLTQFYNDANVSLIIMQFGGNAIPSNEKPSTIYSIVKGLREQVRYLKRCAPDASILFIGPSDMLTTIDGELTTYPLVPYMDRLLRKMAQEEEIAYFSLFRWMGGAGSMIRWQEIGLAGSDGVHFQRSGARKAGNAVADWILNGIDNQ
ncbi:MAG: hypothetical protein K6A36_07460 [Paludibacteraceae bacterium]|nr:hypothetical protein [Paludibacteraceae bacterium]